MHIEDHFLDYKIDSLKVSTYRRICMTIFHSINIIK